MVDIEFLFYILVKIWTKSYHETNTNKFYSIKSNHTQVQNFNPVMKNMKETSNQQN
jgi:hypothetical protein